MFEKMKVKMLNSIYEAQSDIAWLSKNKYLNFILA